MPRRCLYDNAKEVTLGKDETARVQWNLRMLDFALRLGFEIRLCQPYRAQTKEPVSKVWECRGVHCGETLRGESRRCRFET